MRPGQKNVISIGKRTLIVVAVVLALAGGYFAWLWLKPAPSARSMLFTYLKKKTHHSLWTVPDSLRQAAEPWLQLPQLLDQAMDYPTMYQHLAEHVCYADELSLSPDPERRWTGVKVAMEAARGAMGSAVDPWLAARISEAFLVPNLLVAQSNKAGVLPSAPQIVAMSVSAFEASEDSEGLIRTYRRILSRETVLHEGDWARSQLAAIYTKLARDEEALAMLREIKDPTSGGKSSVAQRIANLEKQVAKTPPKPVTSQTNKAAKPN